MLRFGGFTHHGQGCDVPTSTKRNCLGFEANLPVLRMAKGLHRTIIAREWRRFIAVSTKPAGPLAGNPTSLLAGI